MTTDKPSRNEDEYFARQEAELLEKQRQAAAAAAAEKERQSYYMRCPKCGHRLETVQYEAIAIDRCTHCAGVWLDPGELEQLRGPQSSNLLGRIFDDVSSVLSFRKKKQKDGE